VVAAVAAGLFASTTASAQLLEQGAYRYTLAAQAKLTSSNTFGAATAFEREILPNLAHEGDFVIKLQAYNVVNATSVPGYCPADVFSSCNGHERVKVPVSLFTVRGTVAYRWEQFGLFYSGSVTKADVASVTSSAFGAYLSNTAGAFYLYNPFLGPLSSLIDTGEELEKPSYDYVVGASVDLKIFNAYAGYVGSKGFFTNISNPKLYLMFTTLLSNELRELSYLRSGIERLPLSLLNSDLGKTVGASSLFFRRVQVVPPQAFGSVQTAASVSASDLRNGANYALSTVHLEQEDIVSLLDVAGAVASSPKVGLNHLIAGVHTSGYNKNAFSETGSDLNGLSRYLSGLGVRAGVVNVPSQPYFAAPGGKYFSLALEARTPIFRFALGVNDPDILAVFPFATNAVSFSWTVGTSSSEIGSSSNSRKGSVEPQKGWASR
jgi:hypothetical protein